MGRLCPFFIASQLGRHVGEWCNFSWFDFNVSKLITSPNWRKLTVSSQAKRSSLVCDESCVSQESFHTVPQSTFPHGPKRKNPCLPGGPCMAPKNSPFTPGPASFRTMINAATFGPTFHLHYRRCRRPCPAPESESESVRRAIEPRIRKDLLESNKRVVFFLYLGYPEKGCCLFVKDLILSFPNCKK